jgi:hypothetical protein
LVVADEPSADDAALTEAEDDEEYPFMDPEAEDPVELAP